MAYAGLFVVGTLIVLTLGGGVTIWFLRHQLTTMVEDELTDLTRTYRAHGLNGVVAAVQVGVRSGGDLGYFVGEPGRDRLAGSVTPKAIEPGWFDFVRVGDDEDEAWLAKSLRLQDDVWLVVAVDPEPLNDVQELMLSGIGWTVAIALPLALICGSMMTLMILRRIDAITATTIRIRDGGLRSRVPTKGNNDEFDRLALNINAMLDSIQDLTRNIQQVSTGIAHDLRTPLSRLRNTLDIMGANNGNKAATEKMIDGAIGELEVVLETFDALLRIGQIDAGTRRSNFHDIDLSALMSDLVETYEPVASADNKTLTADIVADAHVHGDRPLIVQMLANVIENAIEHTPAGTTIDVALSEQAGSMRIAVADDGPGIPEAERARVFERFYRLDESRQSNGSGLGFSIVAAITKLHDADITLSDNGPGLRVEIAFSAH
jgi:signal transduction histidine kinase